MSEIQTAEIQTLLKSERKGVRNSVRISDVWDFGTTPHLSEIQTGPTIIQHLNAIC